jgi:hypothetical protein
MVFLDSVNLFKLQPEAGWQTRINADLSWARAEVKKADLLKPLTYVELATDKTDRKVYENIDPFVELFQPPGNFNSAQAVINMVEQTIGYLKNELIESNVKKPERRVESITRKNYAFIIMPMNDEDARLIDVHNTIKEAAIGCGITSERIDEQQSNDTITSRILESIGTAEYVIADLTNERPNVFYEAGYAAGLGKTPIYIARMGSKPHFDVKDYPIIFFENMTSLKSKLKIRLQALIHGKSKVDSI